MPWRSGDNSRTLAFLAISANTTIVIPAGWAIDAVHVENTTANAVTGGVKIGTTAGGIDVVAALAVGANVLTFVLDAALLKRFFGAADQTLHVQAVIAWNSAVINMYVPIVRLL